MGLVGCLAFDFCSLLLPATQSPHAVAQNGRQPGPQLSGLAAALVFGERCHNGVLHRVFGAIAANQGHRQMAQPRQFIEQLVESVSLR